MIYLKLFLEFLKVGLFTFGGGYAMIPVVKDVVIKNNWLSIDEFTNMIGICESTPGPFAINMATYVGSIQAGFFGSLLATVGVVLPSYIIILLIAKLLSKIEKNEIVKKIMLGIKPVVVALVLSTGLILLFNCLVINFDFYNIKVSFNIVSLVCFIIIALIYALFKKVFKYDLSAIMIIIISAGLGIFISYIFL